MVNKYDFLFNRNHLAGIPYKKFFTGIFRLLSIYWVKVYLPLGSSPFPPPKGEFFTLGALPFPLRRGKDERPWMPALLLKPHPRDNKFVKDVQNIKP